MRRRLQKLYKWAFRFANTRYSWLVMFICAFADSSFFPLQTPLVFITLSLFNLKNTYNLALYGTLGTVMGTVLGYGIGHFVWLNNNGEFTGLAMFFFNHIPGFTIEMYEKIKVMYSKWDFWILFSAGFTPIPYKLFSISSGVFNLNLLVVLLATLIGHGVRFFILGFIIKKAGRGIKKLFNRNMKPVAIAYALSIIIIIVLFKIL